MSADHFHPLGRERPTIDRRAIPPRSMRRHHVARLKQRWRARQAAAPSSVAPADLGRRIGLRVQTATPCSCPLCGNPRRHMSEPTLQERRASALEFTEDLPG